MQSPASASTGGALLAEVQGVIARRLIRFVKKYSYGTGINGCNAWTMEPRWAKVFSDEAAARKWLAGKDAEVVPASELGGVTPPEAAAS